MAVSTSPVATRYTHEFVERSLPAKASRVLEIGCGSGELAEMLGQAGLKVDALDSDDGLVAEARAKGVEARLGTWPADVGQQYDAVLFTRSLHHIHDLDGAVTAAVSALRPGGLIIVEDFRAEGVSERSRKWFKETVEPLVADHSDAEALLAKIAPATPDHELHSSSAIANALAQSGGVRSEDSAYYFRYVEAQLGSAEITQSLLEQELSLISSGAIDALGKRFVVTPWRRHLASARL